MQSAGIEVIGCDPSPLQMQAFAAACALPYPLVSATPEAPMQAPPPPSQGPRLIESRV